MESFEKILEGKNITQMFGGLTALDNVSFYVKKGEIFGIVGPNGAGKTTLFNIISGIIHPTRGKIIFKDRDITNLKPFQRARIGISRTFQVVRPFKGLNVLDNVAVSYGVEFYSGMLKPFYLRNKTKYKAEVEQILEDVGLIDFKDRMANQLPLGHQRRLEIARALALKPDIILLDESFSGLSFSEIDELKSVVIKLNETGKAFIIIEHHMPVVMGLSKRVMVINYGKKIAEGNPKDIANNKDVIEAYIGRKHTQS